VLHERVGEDLGAWDLLPVQAEAHPESQELRNAQETIMDMAVAMEDRGELRVPPWGLPYKRMAGLLDHVPAVAARVLQLLEPKYP
jgi:hypothetical protein